MEQPGPPIPSKHIDTPGVAQRPRQRATAEAGLGVARQQSRLNAA